MVVDPIRPRIDYYANKQDVDPFPDPALIELHSSDEHLTMSVEIEKMFQRAKDHGFLEKTFEMSIKLVWGHADEFFTNYSDGPAKIYPLHIELTPEKLSVRAKLRYYTEHLRNFMMTLVFDLKEHNFMYDNPSSKRSSAPLIVPKPALDG